MKRFFLVFSILMIVFLLLAGGSLAAVQFVSVRQYNLTPMFLGGWSVTAIPFIGADLTYPQGDLYFVRRVSGGDIRIGDVILYFTADRAAILPGRVAERDGSVLLIDGTLGKRASVPLADAVCRYESRLPGFVSLLDSLNSWTSVGLFTAVLAASILLWRFLPSGKPKHAGLSATDGDISSNLY